MNFLVVPDKFKDSLTAKEVIAAISKGILGVDKTAKIKSVIASDGGDGFLDAISNNIAVEEIIMPTVDPLGKPIKASYLFNKETKAAYIELAKASGLELLQEKDRSAIHTSTYGTGIQIKDAILKGATSIYIGLGGSATNDAGIGIANALGYNFLDVDGRVLLPIGENLSKISKIENKGLFKNTEQVSFFAVNDVNNPLFGTNGAAHVYAKQKGATKEEINTLDKGLIYINKLVREQLDKNNAFVSGAGAAGGAAYGLKTFFNAEYLKGINFLLDLAQVSTLLEQQNIDYIITGEGKIDNQTKNGKLVKGVLQIGEKYNVPVITICGKLEIDKEQQQELGLKNVLETFEPSKGIEYSIKNASKRIEYLIFDFLNQKN